MTQIDEKTTVALRNQQSSWSWLTGHVAAIVVIVIAYAAGLTAAARQSDTFDEGAHLAGGAIHWVMGEPRIHMENGYLSQAIVSLPAVLAGAKLPDPGSDAFVQADPFKLGRMFLYDSGNSPRAILMQGRAMVGLLMGATAFLVYRWSRKLFGPAGGIVSLIAFVFSPLVMANGFLATSDMSVTCFFLLSLASFWWMLERVTVMRVLLTSAALAGLFLSKMSAPLILPVLAGLVVVRALGASEIALGRRWTFASPKAKGAVGFASFTVVGILVWVMIWGAYGFRFAAFEGPSGGTGQTFRAGGWTWALDNSDTFLRCINFAREHHLLPEAYLYGYAYVAQTSRAAITYADGVYMSHAAWWFYPYLFALTTPLPVLVLLGLGVAGLCSAKRRWKEVLYNVSPLLAFAAVYWLAAIASQRGTGPRHLSPVYPVMCVLMGAAWWLPARRRVTAALAGGACVILTVNCLAVWPHGLSYVNEMAGGARHAYRHFSDSAVDWGQDLPALAGKLKEWNTDQAPVYLAYFGTAKPSFYGVEARRLPGFVDWAEDGAESALSPLSPGIYCISATLLDNSQTRYHGEYDVNLEHLYQFARKEMSQFEAAQRNPESSKDWTPEERTFMPQVPECWRQLRFTRLCAYLRKREPTDQAGYSINMYLVSAQDLDAALNGPPPYDRIPVNETGSSIRVAGAAK